MFVEHISSLYYSPFFCLRVKNKTSNYNYKIINSLSLRYKVKMIRNKVTIYLFYSFIYYFNFEAEMSFHTFMPLFIQHFSQLSENVVMESCSKICILISHIWHIHIILFERHAYFSDMFVYVCLYSHFHWCLFSFSFLTVSFLCWLNALAILYGEQLCHSYANKAHWNDVNREIESEPDI